MLWYSLFGTVIAVLTGFAKGSQRRLIVLASFSLLVIYFAFPFATSFGFLSRQTITPTLFGLWPVYPVFLLLPLATFICLVLAWRGHALLAWSSIVTSIIGMLLALLWLARESSLVTIVPLNGLMEAVMGCLIIAIMVLFARSLPRFKVIVVTLGVILGVSFFLWLNSSVGHTFFPNSEGYYKLFRPAPAGSDDAIVEAYNRDLEANNQQRRNLGLNQLEAINSLADLEGQKIPRAAADEGFRLLDPKRTAYGTAVYFVLAGLLFGAGSMLLFRPQLMSKSDMAGGMVFAGVVLSLTPAFAATEFSIKRFIDGWPFLLDFLDRSWPPLLTQPEFDRYPLQEVMSQLLLTIEIALVGTFLAAIFALPLSFFAARNLTQGNALMRTVFALTRGFFNVDRGVDTLILALIFVAAVGLGPFAGILAMAIHSIADLGKVYSESIENVNSGPIEALESVGASGTNVVRWAILPQVMPLIVGWTLYRFEINFRVSIVLGLVGAGGIGFFIQEKMASGQYDQMIIAIIAIVIVVNIIDFASSWLRGKLV